MTPIQIANRLITRASDLRKVRLNLEILLIDERPMLSRIDQALLEEAINLIDQATHKLGSLAPVKNRKVVL